MKKSIEEKFKIIGQNIKYNREKQNLTLEELSEKTNIRKEYLVKIEKGIAVGLSSLQAIQIIIALRVSSEEIFKGI